jgi:hypothetical protein
MKPNFSRFIIKVANFKENAYRKIKVVMVFRINIFYYEVAFKKM